ncbi:hypothetical protein, partial [Pseudomonas aeruginosa]|uniref:hypothetical protein n=1 Tax=Pseudomonas aeruginosa TaxID=287 RepID=UPI001C531225
AARTDDDLFFGKALLHVQSPGQVGLDSNSPCYSKPGGRRSLGMEGKGMMSVMVSPSRPPGVQARGRINSRFRFSI